MNNNPTSEKLTFDQLIGKHKIGRHKIEIPIIQRDYAQGREGKEDIRIDFLNALLEAVKEKGKPLELDFIYGSVKDGVLQPLDGQQRLTTLFLLYWYIASKEGKLDEVKTQLLMFTYETRTSSREFCQALVEKGIVWNKEQKEISKLIEDSSWFFLAWKRDPTIKAMLIMLDAIHKLFKDEEQVWEKLDNISFHYIELENFGLSDDLYIKMNARGKSLTEFENFKAKFEQLIAQNNWEDVKNPTETFSHKIDTCWTDLFWNSHDKNVFDEQIMNFFRTLATINYTLKRDKGDKEDDNFKNNISLLRSTSIPISFNKYSKLGCFDENYFTTLKSVLNKISAENRLKTFLSDKIYVDEEKIFNGAIKNNLEYPDLVIAFAYYQYLTLEDNIEIENFKNWMRIVRNLVEGSRPYLFNDANDFANALHSINNLLEKRNEIIQHFADNKVNSLPGIINEQVNEEKLKAKLIQSEEWKNAIIETENHSYFNGQIGFLLDWCKDENGEENLDKFNINKFKEYSEKSKAIFDNNGLKKFGGEKYERFLFERAMLAIGDYLLMWRSNYSFLMDRERDISWKRLLRGDKKKERKILKQLIDKISISSLTQDLQKIIDDFSDKNDWRYYFIKYPEMIACCEEKKLIRYINDFDILLLSKTATYGYHKEYYSYSLFVKLQKKYGLSDDDYKDQKSVDHTKYFEYKNKQIAFDCNNKKFVWTENEDWDNPLGSGSREDAIKAISELAKN